MSPLLLCSIVIQNIQTFYGGPVMYIATCQESIFFTWPITDDWIKNNWFILSVRKDVVLSKRVVTDFYERTRRLVSPLGFLCNFHIISKQSLFFPQDFKVLLPHLPGEIFRNLDPSTPCWYLPYLEFCLVCICRLLLNQVVPSTQVSKWFIVYKMTHM